MSGKTTISIKQPKVANPKGLFTDPRDLEEYKTVVINQKTWLAENLRYKMPQSECEASRKDQCAIYGQLYNYKDAVKACPNGWRLTKAEDWEEVVGLYEEIGVHAYEFESKVAYPHLRYGGDSGLDIISNTAYCNGGSFMDFVCCEGKKAEKAIYTYLNGAKSDTSAAAIHSSLQLVGGSYYCRCIKE